MSKRAVQIVSVIFLVASFCCFAAKFYFDRNGAHTQSTSSFINLTTLFASLSGVCTMYALPVESHSTLIMKRVLYVSSAIIIALIVYEFIRR